MRFGDTVRLAEMRIIICWILWHLRAKNYVGILCLSSGFASQNATHQIVRQIKWIPFEWNFNTHHFSTSIIGACFNFDIVLSRYIISLFQNATVVGRLLKCNTHDTVNHFILWNHLWIVALKTPLKILRIFVRRSMKPIELYCSCEKWHRWK